MSLGMYTAGNKPVVLLGAESSSRDAPARLVDSVIPAPHASDWCSMCVRLWRVGWLAVVTRCPQRRDGLWARRGERQARRLARGASSAKRRRTWGSFSLQRSPTYSNWTPTRQQHHEMTKGESIHHRSPIPTPSRKQPQVIGSVLRIPLEPPPLSSDAESLTADLSRCVIPWQ